MKRKFQILYPRNPLFEKCPECKNPGSLHRSKARKLIEKLVIYLSLFRIYRCNSCGWRGYRFLLTLTWDSFKALAFYSILVLVTMFIIRFFISKVQ